MIGIATELCDHTLCGACIGLLRVANVKTAHLARGEPRAMAPI